MQIPVSSTEKSDRKVIHKWGCIAERVMTLKWDMLRVNLSNKTCG